MTGTSVGGCALLDEAAGLKIRPSDFGKVNQPGSFGGGLRDDMGALALVIGIECAQHVARGHLAATDRGQHVLDGGAREARQGGLEIVVAIGASGPLKGALDELAAEAAILTAHRDAGGAPDRGSRLSGDDE